MREFLDAEIVAMQNRNRSAVERKRKDTFALQKRTYARMSMLVACMDERNTLTEEALGMHPDEPFRFATGGGKVDAATLKSLTDRALPTNDGRTPVLYLVTHEVIGKPNLGCAAFKNDMAEQERYFNALRDEISAMRPELLVHVVSMDTTAGSLRPIRLDERDASFCSFAGNGTPKMSDWPDEAHAGYGIYVGDAYRSWVNDRNRYFHISSEAPDVAGNMGIALSVMRGHSDVDLTKTPVVVHVDYPSHGDGHDNERRTALDQKVEQFLKDETARSMTNAGSMYVVRTVTDIANGQCLSFEGVK